MADTVVTAKFVADTSSLQSGVKKAATSVRGLEGDVKKAAGGFTVLKGAIGTALGVAAVASIGKAARAVKDFATEAVSMAQESQMTVRRLDAIARSMGVLEGALGGSTDRLTDYAQTLQNQTGVSDESIKSAQALILTFEAVAQTAGETGGLFDRATEAALDLSAAGFGSLESNAVRLARALQDPIKGVTALTRSGVTFTQQEREMIKVLVESGRTFEAQNVIMKAVEKQVGGTAAATATSMDRMRASMADVQENIGFGLLPVLESMAGAFQTHVTPALLEFSNKAKTEIGPELARSFQEMVPTLLSLAESFLSIANSIRSAMAPAMQAIMRLLQSVVPLVDLLAKALAAVPGPVAAVAGALLLLRTRMGQALVAGVATAQRSVATGFASMRASVITFSNTLKVEMVKARTQMGALVAAARTTAIGVGSAFRTMGTAIKGLMASIGPVGWALIAVSVAFEAFSSRSAEAEQRAMEYKDALDQVTGAATRASTEMTIFNLMQKEIGGLYGFGARSFAELASKANLSMTEISAALHGTTEEYDAFIIRVQQAAEQGAINWAEYSLLNEALHEERSALEGARLELENKNKAEAEAAAATTGMTSATVASAIAAGNAIGPMDGLSMSIGGVGGAADEAADELSAMKEEYEEWLSVTGQISAVDKAAESIENLGKASVEFGTDLMGQTPKARDFRAEVITAFEDSAKAAQSLSDDLPTQRAIFTGELVKIVASLRASGVKPRDIEAFLGAMDGLPASVADIMRSAAKAIGDTDFKSQVEKAFDKSVKAGAPMTADAMARLAEGASNAAKEELGLTLEPELASIIKSGTTALRPTAFNNGELTGKSIGSGAAAGITRSSPIVLEAVRRVMAQAKAAADAAVKSDSPSRLFAETGDDMAAGVAMGFTRSARTIDGAIEGAVPRTKESGGKLAKALLKGFMDALAGGGGVAAAIQSIFGNIPTPPNPLEKMLGTEGAEKYIKANKAALRELVAIAEQIDRIIERMEAAGAAIADVAALTARPFGRPSELMQMFGSDADIDGVIRGYLSLRDTITEAYSVLTDASIVGKRAAQANRKELNATLRQLEGMTRRMIALREQYEANLKRLEDAEKRYADDVEAINDRYDQLDKEAAANIKAIEDRWNAVIPGLESAANAARAAYERENKALEGLIQERDGFLAQIASGARSFLNSLSFTRRQVERQAEQIAPTPEIIRTVQDLGNGIRVTTERTVTPAVEALAQAVEEPLAAVDIRSSLQQRLTDIQAFARNIQDLVARGLDPALVRDFVSAGVSGAGEAVAALASGSDDEIRSINAIQQALGAEVAAFGQYAADQWFEAGIAQQEAVVGAALTAQTEAERALARATSLRDRELAAAKAYQDQLKSDREAALEARRALYDAEVAAIEAENAALLQQMDALAAQINAWMATLSNNLAARTGRAGQDSAKKLVEGFRKEYPEVARQLGNLMDRLAASLSRTATITIRTVYEAANPPGARANGGPVRARNAYIVGERGPELFVPYGNGNILPNRLMGDVPAMGGTSLTAGGGSSIVINVNAGMGADGADIGRKVVDALRQYQRRNGPIPVSVSG